MPILNIELGEYDALRQHAANLEAENKRLQKVINELRSDGQARVIVRTVTITHNVQATNPRALDICEEHTELVGFDDVKASVCARYRAEVEQEVYKEKDKIIALQKQQLADKDKLLADAQMKLDRLIKRSWWDCLWNNINL